MDIVPLACEDGAACEPVRSAILSLVYMYNLHPGANLLPGAKLHPGVNLHPLCSVHMSINCVHILLDWLFKHITNHVLSFT